ncbi:hypothetical protein [Streptomyces sp. NBC_01435]|uniref:hypothetical protein n=1 Tax=Streptomyces sp. NBC_01435 TaxID=2903865 RepID=UPI002E37DC3D|nr:hypothetical protein [Streptomyces sp. NBC_01435]
MATGTRFEAAAHRQAATGTFSRPAAWYPSYASHIGARLREDGLTVYGRPPAG